ncbi:DUF4412 domain-containing protein [Thiolapillus sp.]
MRSQTFNLVILSLLLLTGPLLAGGMATIKTGKGSESVTMVLEYSGADKVRMNMPRQQEGNGYMLARDGKAWMVMDMQGQVMVMDMAQMAGMAQGGPPGNDAIKQELLKARKTGRKETVAGYDGEVYEITWRDNRGVHTADVVLSSHPDAVAYSRAWMGFAQNMERAMGGGSDMNKSIGSYLNKEELGMLKMGDEFVVLSIKPGNISESRFKLPKATMQMPFMPR